MDASTTFANAEEGVLQNHVLWMALQLFDMTVSGKSEGKMGRWLGWIQCALFVLGIETVEDAKKANMPAGEAFDRDH